MHILHVIESLEFGGAEKVVTHLANQLSKIHKITVCLVKYRGELVKELSKDIVIIYHKNCRDGFGAAYSAWKKFGDNASYIPQADRKELPEGLTDKEIYILDFGFDLDTTKKLVEENKSVMIIDHHQTAESTVKSFEGNIFDNNHFS